MTASTAESAFQRDIIRELMEGGWVLGGAAGYDRERALYAADCLAFVKHTQPKVWDIADIRQAIGGASGPSLSSEPWRP